MNSRLTILLGTTSATTRWAEALRAAVADYRVEEDESASSWPFRRNVCPPTAPAPGTAVVIPFLHRAFPDGQTGPTHLVLTQSTYQLQRWLDWLDANPQTIVVGDLTNAPIDVQRDARTRRGPWSRLEIVEVSLRSGPALDPLSAHPLQRSFLHGDADLRYTTCLEAVERDTDPALRLALASAAMETGRLDEAEDALRQAGAAAPDWEAVHYELGKLWLRRDDTDRAAAAFAEAARLMPTFAAAHANLGAALGEMERPEEALLALEYAASLDPFGHAVRNNIGASLRDLGRLQEAESSFRRVIALAPTFVFGHYNLGHALFLQGRFDEARQAYEAGLARDLLRTPRQRLRLALTLSALDDAGAAGEHARAALEDTPVEKRGGLLDEVEEVLVALTALQGEGRQAVRAMRQVVDDYRSTTPRS